MGKDSHYEVYAIQYAYRPEPVTTSENGRGERIRTSGPCLPKAVLYQAELHPD